jgi:hypothetical protein
MLVKQGIILRGFVNVHVFAIRAEALVGPRSQAKARADGYLFYSKKKQV